MLAGGGDAGSCGLVLFESSRALSLCFDEVGLAHRVSLGAIGIVRSVDVLSAPRVSILGTERVQVAIACRDPFQCVSLAALDVVGSV